MKQFLLLFSLVFFAASASGQSMGRVLYGNGVPGVQTPDCTQTLVYINSLTGDLYTSQGTPCGWTLMPSGGALPAGVTVTGSGTSQQVAFPGILAANAAVVTGEVQSGNVNAALQPVNKYALRSTRTKLAGMAAHRGGTVGYNAYQLYVLMAGDSTTLFHASQFACNLNASEGAVGYFLTQTSSVPQEQGTRCPILFLAGTTAYAGGASPIGNDFAHFPSGGGSTIPSGGSATFGGPAYSTRQLALYTATTAGVTATVSTSLDGTTWTPLTGCNGVAVTANVGGVCDVSISRGSYYIRVAAGGGTLYVWGVGQVDTTLDGVVQMVTGVGGTSLPDDSSIASAILTPWMAALHPDLITFEMKNNGGNGGTGAAYPACLQATSAAPSVQQNRAYWWNQFISPYLAGNPLADVLIYGSYDINDLCIPVYNNVERSWAASQTHPQTYIDNFSQVSNADMQTLGWIDTSVHELALGQVAHSDMDAAYIGYKAWSTGAETRNVANDYVSTGGGFIAASVDANTPTLGVFNPYGYGTYQSGMASAYIHTSNGYYMDTYLDFSRNYIFRNYNGGVNLLCISNNVAQCPSGTATLDSTGAFITPGIINTGLATVAGLTSSAPISATCTTYPCQSVTGAPGNGVPVAAYVVTTAIPGGQDATGPNFMAPNVASGAQIQGWMMGTKIAANDEAHFQINYTGDGSAANTVSWVSWASNMVSCNLSTQKCTFPQPLSIASGSTVNGGLISGTSSTTPTVNAGVCWKTTTTLGTCLAGTWPNCTNCQ